MKLSITACTVLLGFVMAISPSTAMAMILIIGIDISDSSPFAVQDRTSRLAGKYIQSRIRKMKIGDEIRIRSIGAYGLSSGVIHIDLKITNRKRPRKMAGAVGNYIAAVPRLIREGKLEIQTSTNILGFLDTQAAGLNCSAVPAEIVMLSDGIEHSVFGTHGEYRTGKGLPVPSGRGLSGCDLQFRGLGQLQAGLPSSPKTFPRLKKSWGAYARASGVRRFGAFPAFKGSF